MGGYVAVAALLAGFLVPLATAMYTKNAWEDYYITFRHSANLVLGKGLLFNPPVRLHGFTSPLGTLLPALCYALTFAKSEIVALWIYRVMACFAFSFATLFLVRFCIGPTAPIIDGDHASPRSGNAFLRRVAPALIGGLLFLTDAKSVIFSINGMETGFMLLSLLLAANLLFVDDPRGKGTRLGLICGAIQWCRPDGILYIGAMLVATFLFPPIPRRQLVPVVRKAFGVFLIVYLPWVLWAWWYYGTPVPHTIIAKGKFQKHPSDLIHTFLDIYRKHESLDSYWYGLVKPFLDYALHQGANLFRPIYNAGPWPDWMWDFTYYVALITATLWLIPSVPRRGRCASFVYMCMCCYFWLHPNLFPWYGPPAACFGFLAMAVTLVALLDTRFWQYKLASVAGTAALVAYGLFIFLTTARMLEFQERVIERGMRQKIGDYLRVKADHRDTVFVECLGYIGYYSQCHMLDSPGLVTPEAVALAGPGIPMGKIEMALHPDWIVCRPDELGSLKEQPGFAEQYHWVKTWDMSARVAERKGWYGTGFLEHDQIFHLYRRNVPTRHP